MIRPVEAVLHCGGAEIPYRRWGHGPPLVVVGHAPVPSLGVTEEERLSLAGFRVLVPLVPLPGGAAQADRWMLGLLEGLGLERPGLVLDREAAGILNRFLHRHRERIGIVAILAGGDPDGSTGSIVQILRGGSADQGKLCPSGR